MKYGFVYLWRDKKRKKYYIGCHWGLPNDGYICSSNYMQKAYKRRPDDFTRRILVNDIKSREEMFVLEHNLLQKIDECELGKKYYNLTKHKNSHWSLNETTLNITKQKISSSLRGRTLTNEHKLKIKSSLVDKYKTTPHPIIGRTWSEEERDSRKKTRKSPWNKGLRADENSKVKDYTSKSAKTRLGKPNLISKITTNKVVSCPHCDKYGKTLIMKRWHFDNCKNKGS